MKGATGRTFPAIEIAEFEVFMAAETQKKGIYPVPAVIASRSGNGRICWIVPVVGEMMIWGG